jgi:hypothetical protein
MKDIIQQLNDIKRLSHKGYVNMLLQILSSADFNGIELEDWEIFLIKNELNKINNVLSLPKSVHFNIQNPNNLNPTS